MLRALHTASATTHPHVTALASLLIAGPPQQRLSWGFRMLINGILATPVPRGSAYRQTETR